ncbi:MAG: DeoR/GlpR family DNA-binding transcription regulator [Actinomycetales bacterium]
MSAKLRRGQIAKLLHEQPVSVEELAVRFGVSLSTIRRDLETMAGAGQVVRTYGGARTIGRGERSLLERESIATRQKAAIGRLAVSYVLPGSVNILDAGTTAGALAARLVDHEGITVVTNGLTATGLLEHSEGVTLVVLGGTLRHVSSGMVGPLAEQAMNNITADAAFLGTDGLVAGRGLSEGTAEQASLKRMMVDNAREVYVLADSTKLGLDTSHWWTPLERPWHLITDTDATPEQLEPFRRLGQVEILLARTAPVPVEGVG